MNVQLSTKWSPGVSGGNAAEFGPVRSRRTSSSDRGSTYSTSILAEQSDTPGRLTGPGRVTRSTSWKLWPATYQVSVNTLRSVVNRPGSIARYTMSHMPDASTASKSMYVRTTAQTHGARDPRCGCQLLKEGHCVQLSTVQRDRVFGSGSQCRSQVSRYRGMGPATRARCSRQTLY